MAREPGDGGVVIEAAERRREAPSDRRAAGGLLILTEDSKPALGGIAEYLHQLAIGVAEHVPVRVLTSVPGADEVSADADVRYTHVPWFRTQFPMRGDAWWPVRKLNTARWLAGRERRARRILAEALREPTSLVLLGRLSPVTHPWCAACRRLGMPYEVVAHGLELVEPASPIWRRQRVRDLRGAARVMAVSRATRAIVRELGVAEERITMLTPGVDPATCVAPHPAESLRTLAALGLGGRRFVFSVCYLTYRKGIDLAIEAFARIAARHPDTDYVVAGRGPEQERLEALARRLGVGDRVRFVGAVTDDVKRSLFARCECFVMPTRVVPGDIEGFGIVFLEAALFGKPAVGGDNGGVPDAVVHGETGLLVDTTPGSAPVAAAVERLLSDRDLARRLGQQGRARVLRDFQWRHVIRPMVARLTS